MTEFDRVGNSDKFNFRGGELHRFFKSAKSAPRQCKEKIDCLHSDGSVTYL